MLSFQLSPGPSNASVDYNEINITVATILWSDVRAFQVRRNLVIILAASSENQIFAYGKLISAFVFATRVVQFLFFLNPKFQASNLLLRLYRPVCVTPGLKSGRPVLWHRSSYDTKVWSRTRRH